MNILKLSNEQLVALQKVVDCAREHTTLNRVEITTRKDTGIGTNVYVTTWCKDSEHNHTFDITDYSTW
jgi:hypothetical protein